MLPLVERLRANSRFQQVFAEGQGFGDGKSGCVVVHLLRRPDADERQCGFAVGKKVGNAVMRNQVKRRLREAYRALLPRLPHGYWLVVVARGKAAGVEQAGLARALEAAIVRAGLLDPSGGRLP